MAAHRSTLSRRLPTRRAADDAFLRRTLGSRWFNESETELITAIIRRYHAPAYSDVNELLHTPSPLAKITLLDNYAYLMERVGGPDEECEVWATQVYRDVPRALCPLRHAPLGVRREALAAVRLRRELVQLTLPTGHWAEVGESEPLPRHLIELAVRHRDRIPAVISVIAEQPELSPRRVDSIIEDGIAMPLATGAL